ncbi:MAG: hypothetical protein JSW73_04785, partial [Candidatus Woesearchaeota archaeon]
MLKLSWKIAKDVNAKKGDVEIEGTLDKIISIEFERKDSEKKVLELASKGGKYTSFKEVPLCNRDVRYL